LAANTHVFGLDAVVVAPAVEGTGRKRTLRARAVHIVHPDLRGPAAKGLTIAPATNHSLKILENQCPSFSKISVSVHISWINLIVSHVSIHYNEYF